MCTQLLWRGSHRRTVRRAVSLERFKTTAPARQTCTPLAQETTSSPGRKIQESRPIPLRRCFSEHVPFPSSEYAPETLSRLLGSHSRPNGIVQIPQIGILKFAPTHHRHKNLPALPYARSTDRDRLRTKPTSPTTSLFVKPICHLIRKFAFELSSYLFRQQRELRSRSAGRKTRVTSPLHSLSYPIGSVLGKFDATILARISRCESHVSGGSPQWHRFADSVKVLAAPPDGNA